MEDWHLAQVNVATLAAPLDPPRLAAFVERLEPVNALAERSPGFVWRPQGECGDATDRHVVDDLPIAWRRWPTVSAERAPGKDARMQSNGAERPHQEYRLPHSPGAPALARRLVEEHLSPMLDEERGADLIVLTSELVSNAVRHSPPLADGGHQLLFEVDADAIRVAVTDGGNHLDPDEIAFEGPGDDRFGMVFLDRWADGWGFSLDGVKGVWFKVKR